MNDQQVIRQLQQALGLHQAGRIDEADRAYRAVLAARADQPDALNLLGVLCLERGRIAEAEQLIARAVQVSPQQPLFHLHLGNAQRAAGKVDRAIGSWRRAIALAPAPDQTLDARTNIAVALTSAGDVIGAEQAWRELSHVAPHVPEAHFQLGQLLASQRRFGEAAEALGTCLRLDPARFVAHNALGCALAELGQHEQAAAAFARAAELSPRDAAFQLNLGHARRAAGHVAEAHDAFRRAIELSQSILAAAQHGLAATLREMNQLEDAERAANEALHLQPDFAPGHQNLGNIQYDLGRLDDAVASHRRSLELNPHDATVRTGLLLLLHYRHGDDPQLLFDEHRRWGKLHADPLMTDAPPHDNDRDPNRAPLRVGYVSADLRDHPVAYFFEPILAAHDKSRVQVTLYSSTLHHDDYTARMRSAADAWHDVRALPDDQLAALVREHRIDILVDLSGHIAANRLLAFARRPAPVQVTYLGYPNTTGMRAMNWRFTDAWHDPPGQTEQFHTEQLWRLPGGAWCYRPRPQMPQVSALPADSNGFVTFFSPNKVAKVTDEMLELWRQILARVPDARLMALTGGDRAGAQRIRAALRDVDHSRLELIARTSVTDYFNLYRRSDVVLDTFPYNGHTTTCDALWMGLPVITLAGQTHASRAGLSVSSKVGLEHFVSDHPERYAECAVEAATDRDALREIRATMRQRLIDRGLTDGARLAREIEDAYRDMWRRSPSPSPREGRGQG
jgi:predicted O-linked N-acetylglucosamine transferase (SPINDLY family)